MRWLDGGVVWSRAGAAENLVANSGFETADGQTLPEGWSVWTPQWSRAACRVRGTADGLLIESGGDPYAVGGVVQEIKGVRPARRIVSRRSAN